MNLTPKQEKFINLQITGKSLTDIAKELKVDRSTLYAWKELETVQARYNQLVTDLKNELENGLISLYSKAVQAVGDCLDSLNDQVSLKTALYLIEKVDALNPGLTDAREIIRKKATTSTFGDPLAEFEQFDEDYYHQRLKELNLAESGT